MSNAIGTGDVALDAAIFGGMPGLPGVSSIEDTGAVNATAERPASQEYFTQNKVLGIPVDPEYTQLAIRESDNIEELFEPVGHVHTICFLCSPTKQDDKNLQLYNEVLSAVDNGTASIVHEDRSYDSNLQGYVVMLTYSTAEMVLKPAYRGHFNKLSDITGAENV